MKRTFLLIALLFSFVSTGNAEVLDVFHFSGNEWVRWDVPSKYGFIGGFIAGGAYVAISSQADMINKDMKNEEVSTKKPGEKKDEITSLIMYLQDDNEKDMTRFFIKGIASDKLVAGLDELYINSHHRSIKVVDAIYLVRKKIEGVSSDEINATLEYLISGKDIKKLHFTDKNGKFQAVTFP
ncbi:MAG: hypothetical protein Q7U10_11125 [Thermodesulfovibrionia bacterium]|nr:hypothetical protein [Thermodesulfovibrionia bacterium]